MYKYILVPLDGSRFSQRVLPYAKRLAKGLGIPIVLFHAVEPDRFYSISKDLKEEMRSGSGDDGVVDSMGHAPNSSDSQTPRYLDLIIAGEKTTAETYLTTVAESLEQEGIDVSTIVVVGRASQSILDVASKNNGGIIAMSTHGRSGLARWVLGSVASKVVYSSNIPVMLLRPSQDAGTSIDFSNVVVPLDGSLLSESILPTAAEVAKAMHLPVHLMQAISLTGEVWVGPEPGPYYAEDITKALEHSYDTYLDGIVEKLKEDGVEADRTVVIGPPDVKIGDIARDAGSSLIMMATRARTNMERWLFGSVTEKVIRSAAGPVMVMRSADQVTSEAARIGEQHSPFAF